MERLKIKIRLLDNSKMTLHFLEMPNASGLGTGHYIQLRIGEGAIHNYDFKHEINYNFKRCSLKIMFEYFGYDNLKSFKVVE